MKRFVPLLAVGAAIIVGVTAADRDVSAGDVGSTGRRIRRVEFEPYMINSSNDMKYAELIVHAPENSYVRLLSHVSIDVSTLSPDDPTKVAYMAFLETSAEIAPALSATSSGQDVNGDGVVELTIPQSRLDETMSNAAVMATSTYAMAHTKFQYVVDDGVPEDLQPHAWVLSLPQWDFLESQQPPVRTARNFWFTQTKASLPAPSQTPAVFSKTLMAEAALATQLGQSVADYLIQTDVPNGTGSIFSSLCAAGVVQLTVQACVIKNPNQQPWNGVGVPVWNPAEGWEEDWGKWSHTLTWTLTFPYPLPGGGSGGTMYVQPGGAVNIPLEGFAPPMTAQITVAGQSFSVAVSYVSRRVARFTVPAGAPAGPIVLWSLTHPHVGWMSGSQGLQTGNVVQIPH